MAKTADADLPAVAHLVAPDNRIVGGIAQRGEEFVLVLAGRVMAATESAGMAMAMLRHAQATLATLEAPLTTRVAPALEAPAIREAVEAGFGLEDYLKVLEAERVERAERRSARDH